MFNRAALFIGLRYARASKANHFIAFVNFFSVAGISLGLAALIVVSSVMNGFEGQLKAKVLGVIPHLMVNADVDTVSQAISPTHFDNLVEGVSAQIESEGVIQTNRGLRGVLFQGIQPELQTFGSSISEHIIAGRFDSLKPGEYHVVIGRFLASQLNVSVGDQVRLLSASASVYSPTGRIPSQRLFTIGGVFDVGSSIDDKVILLHSDDLARLMRKKPQTLQKTRIYLHDPFDFDVIQQDLLKHDLKSENWRVRQGALFDAVKTEKNVMKFMLGLIIAVAAFNIVSALIMVATEKRADMAILQTQGLEPWDLSVIFLTNGLYNGLKGSVVGLVLGLSIALLMNPLLNALNVPILALTGGAGLPVIIDWSQVGLMTLLSLSLCVFASVFPARFAAKTHPAAVLRYE